MIIWNFLNTYHLQKYYFTVTSENSKNNLNVLFKKALEIDPDFFGKVKPS